ADLGIALAIASAARNLPVREGLAAFGELGLTGELRWVGHPERRLAEARKFGLEEVLAPPGAGGGEVPTLREALARALPARAAPSQRIAA
ncbi:MAG: magnesium chelatase domain-containing protein, partial [Solirubrobacteraceae bacterium]